MTTDKPLGNGVMHPAAMKRHQRKEKRKFEGRPEGIVILIEDEHGMREIILPNAETLTKQLQKHGWEPIGKPTHIHCRPCVWYRHDKIKDKPLTSGEGAVGVYSLEDGLQVLLYDENNTPKFSGKAIRKEDSKDRVGKTVSTTFIFHDHQLLARWK